MLDENIHKINIIITYFRDLVNIKYSENKEISDQVIFYSEIFFL